MQGYNFSSKVCPLLSQGKPDLVFCCGDDCRCWSPIYRCIQIRFMEMQIEMWEDEKIQRKRDKELDKKDDTINYR